MLGFKIVVFFGSDYFRNFLANGSNMKNANPETETTINIVIK